MSNGKDDISTYDFSMIFNNINKVSEVKDENNVDNSEDNLYNTNLISELDLQNFDPKRYEYYTNLVYIYRKDKKTLYDLLRKYYSIKNLKGKEKKLIRTISNYARLHREADGATETPANTGEEGKTEKKPPQDLEAIVQKLLSYFNVDDETLKGRDFEDKVFFLIMNIINNIAKDTNIILTEEIIDKLTEYVSEVLQDLNAQDGGMLRRDRGRRAVYIPPNARSLTRPRILQRNVPSLGRESINGDSRSEDDAESTLGYGSDTESTSGDEDDQDDILSNKDLQLNLNKIIEKENLTKYKGTYNSKNSDYINLIEEILLGKKYKIIDEETTKYILNFIIKYKEYKSLKMTGGVGEGDKDITAVVSATMNSVDNTASGLDNLMKGIEDMQKKNDPIEDVPNANKTPSTAVPSQKRRILTSPNNDGNTENKFRDDLALLMQRISKLEATVLQNTPGTDQVLLGEKIAKEGIVGPVIKKGADLLSWADKIPGRLTSKISKSSAALYKIMIPKDDGKNKLKKEIEESIEKLQKSSKNVTKEIIKKIYLNNAKTIEDDLQLFYNLNNILLQPTSSEKNLLKEINKKLVLLYEDENRNYLIKYTVRSLYNELLKIKNISTETIDVCSPNKIVEGSFVQMKNNIKVHNVGKNIGKVKSINDDDSLYVEFLDSSKFNLPRANATLVNKNVNILQNVNIVLNTGLEGSVIDHQNGGNNCLVKFSEDSVHKIDLQEVSCVNIVNSIVKIEKDFLNQIYIDKKCEITGKKKENVDGTVKISSGVSVNKLPNVFYLVKVDNESFYVQAKDINLVKGMTVIIDSESNQNYSKTGIITTAFSFDPIYLIRMSDGSNINAHKSDISYNENVNINSKFKNVSIRNAIQFKKGPSEFNVIKHTGDIIRVNNKTLNITFSVNTKDITNGNIKIQNLVKQSKVKLNKELNKNYNKIFVTLLPVNAETLNTTDLKLTVQTMEKEIFKVDSSNISNTIKSDNDVQIIGEYEIPSTENKVGVVKAIYDKSSNIKYLKITLDDTGSANDKYVIRVEYDVEELPGQNKKNVVNMLYNENNISVISTKFIVNENLTNNINEFSQNNFDKNTSDEDMKKEIDKIIKKLQQNCDEIIISINKRIECVRKKKQTIVGTVGTANSKEDQRIDLLKQERAHYSNLNTILNGYINKSLNNELDYLNDIINSLYPDQRKKEVVIKIINGLLKSVRINDRKAFLEKMLVLINKLNLIQKEEQSSIYNIIEMFEKHKPSYPQDISYIYYIDKIIIILTTLFTVNSYSNQPKEPFNTMQKVKVIDDNGNEINGTIKNYDYDIKSSGNVNVEILKDDGTTLTLPLINIIEIPQTGGAQPIDDDVLKARYLNNDLNDNNDDELFNELIELQSQHKNGKIKTKNKIEQLSNDIDVYNKLDPQSLNDTKRMIQQINNFENDPNNPIEELALTFDDRLVFIIATFFIRYITIMLVQWCIDINIIKTFYEGFIYYAVIYIIIFWFIVLFINVDNSYDVNYMNFNGIINSIRTLFYYFYMGTNGISRLLIHTSLIIILIIVPILLNIKNKVEYVDEEESENTKLLNNEERKQLSRALSLFTMFIWLFTSIIATKF